MSTTILSLEDCSQQQHLADLQQSMHNMHSWRLLCSKTFTTGYAEAGLAFSLL
jgi:hypothetical protein